VFSTPAYVRPGHPRFITRGVARFLFHFISITPSARCEVLLVAIEDALRLGKRLFTPFLFHAIVEHSAHKPIISFCDAHR
jgi:hypothetical protein